MGYLTFVKYSRMLSEVTKNVDIASKYKLNSENALLNRNLIFSSVSHELRNPLNCLLGAVDYALRSNTDEVTKNLLLNGQACGEILLNLINNILDLAKLDFDQLTLSKQTRDMAVFTSKIWSMSQDMIKKSNLQGDLYLQRGLPRYLVFDEPRMTQILFNLVTNACKYTPPGGSVKIIFSFDLHSASSSRSALSINSKKDEMVDHEDLVDSFTSLFHAIGTPNLRNSPDQSHSANSGVLVSHSAIRDQQHVQTNRYSSMTNISESHHKRFMKYSLVFSTYRRQCTEPQHTLVEPASDDTPRRNSAENRIILRIEVIDSGCGIHTDDIPRLLKPFTNEKVDGEQVGGTRLGLYITKALTSVMGGTVSCVSELTSGSVFTVRIPLEVGQKKSTPKEAMEITLSSPKEDLSHAKKMHLMFVGDDSLRAAISEGIAQRGLGIKVHHFPTMASYFSRISLSPEEFAIVQTSAPSQERYTDSPPTPRTQNDMIINTLLYQKSENTSSPPQKQDTIDGKPISENTTLESLMNTIQKIYTLKKHEYNKQFGILLVDDDHFNIKVMSQYIAREGYTVITALDGIEGFEKFEENRHLIKLILMDNEMPRCNGPECTKKIQEYLSKERIPQIPIIGVSGNVSNEKTKECLDAGMIKVLDKPVKMTYLMQVIQRELNSM